MIDRYHRIMKGELAEIKPVLSVFQQARSYT